MLKIMTNFSTQYVESLKITFVEQKKKWEYFCNNVPIFKKVNCEEDIDLIAKIVHTKYINIVNNSASEYEKWWLEKKYNVEETLESLFEVKISETICATVCITPLFPRNIKEMCFLLPTNASKVRFYNIVTHELIHFYYYRALQQLNINVNDIKIWKISELIVEPLIKYLFPDYIYLHNTYHFSKNENDMADRLIKLYISKEINLIELVRRMTNDYKNKK